MDRNEAVLRELNLYPLWVRRGKPLPEAVQEAEPVVETAIEVTPTVSPDPSGKPSSLSIGPLKAGGRVAGDSVIGEERAAAAVVPIGRADRTREQRIGDLGWPELKQRVRDCTACKLRAGCTQTVFGVGDEQADWLFVGEGPGDEEDARGEPFVGQAGKLLDNMLMAIKLKRGENVYIANVVKCCPSNNRNPDAEEIAQCLPYLQRQIELIQPKLIVALGKTASNALLGKDAPLGSLRGKLHDLNGIPLVVTYHPAYLLRSPSEKAKAWQDLCLAVRARHGEA